MLIQLFTKDFLLIKKRNFLILANKYDETIKIIVAKKEKYTTTAIVVCVSHRKIVKYKSKRFNRYLIYLFIMTTITNSIIKGIYLNEIN